MQYEVNTLFPYLLTFAVTAVCFGLAALIANMVNYKPSDPGTTKRRVWFWVLCVLGVLIPFIVNFCLAMEIQVDHLRYEYLKNSCIAAFVFAVVYILVGFIISKANSHKKIGSWF